MCEREREQHKRDEHTCKKEREVEQETSKKEREERKAEQEMCKKEREERTAEQETCKKEREAEQETCKEREKTCNRKDAQERTNTVESKVINIIMVNGTKRVKGGAWFTGLSLCHQKYSSLHF